MSKSTSLGTVLVSYFEDYLRLQKGLSSASIHSYRDALQLFLQFVSVDKNQKITKLALSDLTAKRVQQFLIMLEQKRENCVRTRNQRLSIIHDYFDYMATHVPEALNEAQKVAAIPMKRVNAPETYFLSKEQVKQLFDKLPNNTRLSLRNRALLLVLYNTGARVQEVANLKVRNLELLNSLRIHLHGKGDKWRICPLWKDTAKLLQKHLINEKIADNADSAVFLSISGKPLTRFGIYKIVQKYTQDIMLQSANQRRQKVSPHVFRHTTAVHLLESGVELNVIRAWLGHTSIETTNRYAEITLRMKEGALAACEPPETTKEVDRIYSGWKDDKSLINWLKSL